jgi:outer membrane protein
MKRRRLVLLFLVAVAATQIGFSCDLHAAGAETPVLSLEEAIAIAVKDNRQVRMDLLEIQKAEEATAGAKTAFLPKFTTYALAGRSIGSTDLTIPRGTMGTYPVLGALPATDSTVTSPGKTTGIFYGAVTQPLSQIYRVHLGVNASKLREEIAQEGYRGKRSETAGQVREVYAQIALTQSQLEAAESTRAYLRELSLLTERHLREKTVLKSDSLTVEARIGQVDHRILMLENGLATRKEALNRLLGRDVSDDFAVEATPPESDREVDLATAREAALRGRFEVRQAHTRSQLAEVNVHRARAEHIPDISLQYTHLELRNIDFLPKEVSHVGILFQWEPFAWGKKVRKTREEDIALRQAQLALKETEQQIILDVSMNHRRLVEARALIGVQKAFQEAEAEKSRIMTEQYRQKATLLSDLLQQQAAAEQASAQYQQALSSYWTARAAFSRAIGDE